MTEIRKKLGFEVLLESFFLNLGRLILTNLVFAVPMIVAVIITYALFLLLPEPVLVFPLIAVFAAPFYPGVVTLSRDISTGAFSGGLLRLFIDSVKDNWFRSLITSIVLYGAFVLCYFSIAVYSIIADGNWLIYLFIFVVALIALFFLFFSYAVYLMIVSFDLKLRDIFKNSALMTFGEIKQNFFITFACVLFLAVVLMPALFILHLSNVMSSEIVSVLLFSYLGLVFATIIPASCSFFVSYYLYPNMRSVIAGEREADPEEEANTSTKFISEQIRTSADEDLDALCQGDPDEYIFYNGKMLKRSTLVSIMEEKKEDKNA